MIDGVNVSNGIAVIEPGDLVMKIKSVEWHVWNSAKFICDAVDSLIRQGFWALLYPCCPHPGNDEDYYGQLFQHYLSQEQADRIEAMITREQAKAKEGIAWHLKTKSVPEPKKKACGLFRRLLHLRRKGDL